MHRILVAWCWIVAGASLSARAVEPFVLPHAQPALQALASAPSEAELRTTNTALVGFGTRHTLSDIRSATRGNGAARRRVQTRFAAISRDCGGYLDAAAPAQAFTGKRMPQPTEVMDVVAVKCGSSDPQRVIVITGHLDSRVSDVMDATSDAPGANDDASGVAALIEVARLLAKQDNRATLVFAALSGEEQYLYGGIDFRYPARVTALNAITMAAPSRAPAPPGGMDTHGRWPRIPRWTGATPPHRNGSTCARWATSTTPRSRTW